MTIKRRLFISNILMILVPLVVSIAVFYGGLYVFTSVSGLRDENRFRGGRIFGAAVRSVDALAHAWADEDIDLQRVQSDVAAFNERFERETPFLLAYRNGVLVTPDPRMIQAEVLTDALARAETTTFLGRMGLHTQRVGEYQLVLRDLEYFTKTFPDYRDVMRMGTLLALLASVAVVLITNWLLIRFVFRRIVGSLDTLSSGVHQIRDGNLDYRIDYRGDDEFSPVCEDFNIMAARLEQSVEERRRGEINRRELIAGISHDLRTPLTSIKAYIEGIEKGVASTPEAFGRYVATIKNKAFDLERIIDSLFMFTKLDTGEFPYAMERVELEPLVCEMVGGLKGEYEARGLEVSLDVKSSGTDVEVDMLQLRNIIINVLENSLKYGGEGTKMRVEVDADKDAGKGAGPARYARIVLADDGPGVPEASIGKIFDVFYRSDPSRKEPGKGSGLGLAIAVKIVKHFGGTITARNQTPHGLTIIIALPVCT